jgi:dUTP pyrophosphatase
MTNVSEIPSQDDLGVRVGVRLLDPDAVPPSSAHDGDAGTDLVSTIDVMLAAAGGRSVVPTGIAVAIPPGFAGFVLPRSGLAANHGVTVLNGPGLIDSGYRGEVRVPLVNTDPTRPAQIRRGDRIAQLVVLPVPRIVWDVLDELPDSASDVRGAGGFGSSGR